jgi:hypothetical protein
MTINAIISIIIALGIFNVWIFRFNKSSEYRAGNAKNMKEEFSVYGLSGSFMKFIGFLKITLSLLLIMSTWIPAVARPSAIGMAVLMIGAIFMHFRAKDPPKKSLPAFTLLVLSLIVAYL